MAEFSNEGVDVWLNQHSSIGFFNVLLCFWEDLKLFVLLAWAVQ